MAFLVYFVFLYCWVNTQMILWCHTNIPNFINIDFPNRIHHLPQLRVCTGHKNNLRKPTFIKLPKSINKIIFIAIISFDSTFYTIVILNIFDILNFPFYFLLPFFICFFLLFWYNSLLQFLLFYLLYWF